MTGLLPSQREVAMRRCTGGVYCKRCGCSRSAIEHMKWNCLPDGLGNTVHWHQWTTGEHKPRQAPPPRYMVPVKDWPPKWPIPVCLVHLLIVSLLTPYTLVLLLVVGFWIYALAYFVFGKPQTRYYAGRLIDKDLWEAIEEVEKICRCEA